jgi:hypothetical protein
VVSRADSDRHSTALVAADLAQLAQAQRPGWQAEGVSFEEMVLAYLQRPPTAESAGGHPSPGGRPGGRPGSARRAVTS